MAIKNNKISNIKIIIFEIIIIILSIGILFQIANHNEKLYSATQNKLLMLQTANRLKQSSDDLTHFARTYVVTGNIKFKKQYQDTLDIRDGKKARPKSYHSIYWDLNENIRDKNHPDTSKISLDSIFNSLPYNEEEIKKLKLSKKYSDQLVSLELEAFNAMNGLFKDNKNKYTIKKEPNQNLAIQIMHSKEYYDAKEKIMEPIDDFILILDKRTSEEILYIKSTNKPFFIILGILFILFIVGNYLILKILKAKDEQTIIDKNRLLNTQKKLNKELKESQKELDELNKNLEKRIDEEVKKNSEIQTQLFKSEKMAAMGEMIGNIAHHWRQPLSVISTTATGMILQSKYEILTDDTVNKSCNTINDNAQYLSKTINDFRDFIKGGKVKSEFNLKEEIQSSLVLVESIIKQYNINIILDLDDNIQINSYKSELIQCFINIINNSKDAFDEKIKQNRLIFISSKINNNQVIIKIKDNAGGIDEKIISKIYDPYFTTKHQSQGTGLGLHTTYNIIVDSMKGSIEAKNVSFIYDQNNYIGAEIIIILPL